MHRRGNNVILFSRYSPAAKLRHSLATACLAGTALVTPALAQDAAQLPTLEVTSPTLVPTPVDQIASSITIITAADIARDQRRTVVDALQAVPGLNIVQTGGPGAQTSIFMRGTNANHTKILIDGIDMANSSNTNGAYDLGHLTTADIERIEVLRGPQSGLYGSDAIGGVISITTKKGQGPARITAMVEGGSQGTVNAAAGVSGSQDKFSYAFNVSNYQTSSTPVTPLELLPPGQRRINDSVVNRTVSTKLGYDVTQDFALNFVGRYTDAKVLFTGDNYNNFPATPADQQSSQLTQEFFSRNEAVWSLFDGRFKNYFGVNYSNQKGSFYDPYGYLGPLSINRGERLKYDWRGVASIMQGQTLVVGAEHEKEKFNNEPGDGSRVTAKNANRGAFAELQSNFGNRLFLTSNVRVDDNDAFGDHTTFRIAPAFIVPGTDTKLKASYGTGFKAPTLAQLYDATYGNPNLRPEESKGYDVGFEQPIANDHIRFGTTYFNNDITNLIVTTGNYPAISYANVKAAKTSGFETFAAITFNERFSVRFDHTYTDAIDADTGLKLNRRPTNKMSYAFIWKPVDELTLSTTLIVLGQFQDVTRFGPPTVTNPGYKLVNLAANYRVADGVTAFARIDNLFNEQYQDPTGFLRPGLGVFGGIRLTSAPIGN